VHNLYIDYLTN